MSYGQQLTLTHLDMAHFNLGEYVGRDFLHSMMMVAMKQVYGYVIWFALALPPSSCCAIFLLSVQISAKFPAGRFMPSSILREGSKGAGKAEDFIGSDITALRICFWVNSDIRITASGTTRTEGLALKGGLLFSKNDRY